MGKEFTIIKEFSTVNATLAELVAVDHIIKQEIPSAAFRTDYVSLIADIHDTYQGVVTLLTPFTQLLDEQNFSEHFDKVYSWYQDSYQAVHSNSRVNAEYTFEKYLQFRKLKEVNTKYPPLQSAFGRLHDFIDKWIDNDIWLSLCIDTVLKMLNQVLNDVAKMKAADVEEAFNYYSSCVAGLAALLEMVAKNTNVLAESLELEATKKAS